MGSIGILKTSAIFQSVKGEILECIQTLLIHSLANGSNGHKVRKQTVERAWTVVAV